MRLGFVIGVAGPGLVANVEEFVRHDRRYAGLWNEDRFSIG